MAYMPTAKPPLTIRPRHNVIIRWCDWGGFTERPDTSRPLRTQTERVESLRAWAKISPGLAVWDYNLGNAPANIPYNPVPVLVDDLRLPRQCEIKANSRMIPYLSVGFYQKVIGYPDGVGAQGQASGDTDPGVLAAASGNHGPHSRDVKRTAHDLAFSPARGSVLVGSGS